MRAKWNNLMIAGRKDKNMSIQKAPQPFELRHKNIFDYIVVVSCGNIRLSQCTCSPPYLGEHKQISQYV
ncbi:hypothetical protein AAA082_11350 [[Ruminococcus] torques]